MHAVYDGRKDDGTLMNAAPCTDAAPFSFYSPRVSDALLHRGRSICSCTLTILPRHSSPVEQLGLAQFVP